ncbi:major facilitator superfamily domain-containing protein [Kalaharituber pfeilii]|nr:major facilitator superfamily domain-containing protein [Kalaharituber pfeilii]
MYTSSQVYAFLLYEFSVGRAGNSHPPYLIASTTLIRHYESENRKGGFYVDIAQTNSGSGIDDSGRTGSATPIGSINTLDQRHNEVDLKTSTVGNYDVEDAAAEREISVVGWDSETDSENPLNWPKKRKLLISLTSCLQAVQCTLCACIFTPGVKEITRDLKTSNELALTALTFYVMGFALGPLVWSPMSEVYGRNYVYHRPWPIFTVIKIGCALAPNIATLLVCRFIAGFTGGTAVTIPAGGMADIWTSDEIGPPIGMFLMQAYLGPIIGPLIGGLPCRICIMEMDILALLDQLFCARFELLVVSGDFRSNILLERKAKRLREQQPKTDTTRILAPNEVHKKSKAEVFRAAIWRPWRLLFLEPIVFLVALYISFVNGVLHLYFAAYPIVYRGLYHWDVGNAGLPFIGLAVGILLGGVVAKHMNQVHIRLKTDYVAKTGSTIYPEGRLPYAIIASFLVPGSMFWFAWSGDGKDALDRLYTLGDCGSDSYVLGLPGIDLKRRQRGWLDGHLQSRSCGTAGVSAGAAGSGCAQQLQGSRDAAKQSQGVDPTIPDTNNNTPLMLAAMSAAKECLELLAHPVVRQTASTPNTLGHTPLTALCSAGCITHNGQVRPANPSIHMYIACLKLLLQTAPDIDLRVRDSTGKTPLEWAAQTNNTGAMELLQQRALSGGQDLRIDGASDPYDADHLTTLTVGVSKVAPAARRGPNPEKCCWEFCATGGAGKMAWDALERRVVRF